MKTKTIIAIAAVLMLGEAAIAKPKTREKKTNPEAEQMKNDILADKGPALTYFYKGPECLPSSTWQMARIQSPKEVLTSNPKCEIDIPKFELSDTKGKKIAIKCGFLAPLNYFVDEESCTKFHDSKFKR